MFGPKTVKLFEEVILRLQQSEDSYDVEGIVEAIHDIPDYHGGLASIPDDHFWDIAAKHVVRSSLIARQQSSPPRTLTGAQIVGQIADSMEAERAADQMFGVDQGPLKALRITNSARAVSWFHFLARRDYGSLDMNQPYQRGVVWGRKRQANLIRSIKLGIPIPAIVINNRAEANFHHPGYDEDRLTSYSVIDGKQRASTLIAWMDGELAVPRSWWWAKDLIDGLPEDLREVTYTELSRYAQRGFENGSIAVCEGKLSSLKDEEEVFNLLNFGGLSQGEVDDDV